MEKDIIKAFYNLLKQACFIYHKENHDNNYSKEVFDNFLDWFWQKYVM